MITVIMQINVMSEKCYQSEVLSTLLSSVETDNLEFTKNKDNARNEQFNTWLSKGPEGNVWLYFLAACHEISSIFC